jgi:hypothetical protein
MMIIMVEESRAASRQKKVNFGAKNTLSPMLALMGNQLGKLKILSFRTQPRDMFDNVLDIFKKVKHCFNWA